MVYSASITSLLLTTLVVSNTPVKVESSGSVNPTFDPSFCVKKVTLDPNIIEKFEEDLLHFLTYLLPKMVIPLDDLISNNIGENFSGELSPTEPIELTLANGASVGSLEDSVFGSSTTKVLNTIEKEKDP